MLYKIKLKNAEAHVVISGEAYEYLEGHQYYRSLNLLENLRQHSSGYVFFQRNFPTKEGKYKNVTLYLHKLIAERFVGQPESDKRLFVRIINGNPLDCRIQNLEWTTMSNLRRNQKRHHNKTGYRGVVQVSKNSFRAVLYTAEARYDLGLYSSAEEAAEAYNKKSLALFGQTRSLNKITEEPATLTAQELLEANEHPINGHAVKNGRNGSANGHSKDKTPLLEPTRKPDPALLGNQPSVTGASSQQRAQRSKD